MIDSLTYDLVDHLEKLISQDGETERTRVYLAGVIILGSDSCSVDHSLAQLLWEPEPQKCIQPATWQKKVVTSDRPRATEKAPLFVGGAFPGKLLGVDKSLYEERFRFLLHWGGLLMWILKPAINFSSESRSVFSLFICEESWNVGEGGESGQEKQMLFGKWPISDTGPRV